jgi:hypothetical protein
MRRPMTALLLGALLALASLGSALGHVHGITPLNCLDGDPAHAGANRTNTTPASSTVGGPISGLIPSTVGNASLASSDGGRDAAPCDTD